MAFQKDAFQETAFQTTYGISSLIISITPMGGVYTQPQNITLSTNLPGTIYYTLDGSTPTPGSTEYTGPIPITAYKTVLNYFAVDEYGNCTEVHTQSYQIGTKYGSQIDYGKEIRDRLPDHSPLQDEGNPGRILIDECLGQEFSGIEIALIENGRFRLITNATGLYLDYYGQLFGFPRPPGMSDDTYRANLISLRIANITIQGLREAISIILNIPISEITVVNNTVNYCKAGSRCNASLYQGTACKFGGHFRLTRNGITITVPSGSNLDLLWSVIYNMVIPGITIIIVED